MRKRLGWTLVAAGAACGLLAIQAFVVASLLGAHQANLPSGRVLSAVRSAHWGTPSLMRWGGGQELNNATGFAVLALAVTAVLLLIAGGRVARSLAVASFVFLVYYGRTFSRGGYWHNWMGNRMELTPSLIATTIWFILILSVGLVAIATGRRLLRTDPEPLSA